MQKITRIVLLSVLFSDLAYTYEINTHAFMSQKAYERSVLSPSNSNSILPTIGLDRWPKAGTFDFNPALPTLIGQRRYFDDIDIDQTFQTAITRPTEGQEETAIGLLYARGYVPGFSTLDEAQSSIPGWLMRGAIREDDNDGKPFPNALPFVWATGDDRDLDPYGRLLRAVKHFYDPIRNLAYPYRKECVEYDYVCIRSTTWAMGTIDPLSPTSDSADPLRRNHFTWVDARNSYYLALTENIDADGDGQRTFLERLDSSVDRTWRFATTIKSLGHVIHLLQDTAQPQPQHVRSDAHAPPAGTEVSNDEGLTDAAIEAFTDYRLLGDYDAATALSIPGNPIRYMDESLPSEELIAPLIVGSYPGAGQKVQFSTPVKFFTTRHVDAQITARRGLADFTNRSFYTSGLCRVVDFVSTQRFGRVKTGVY